MINFVSKDNKIYLKIMKIQIINGPNLNLLGVREPDVYGSSSFPAYLDKLKAGYPEIAFAYFQSNIEGEIINRIQESGFSFDGIILNAGAYTHTSIAIYDAIKAVNTPVIEVHISNVHSREEFRRQSLIAGACKGVIAGFGFDSYRLAVEAIIDKSFESLC
jgi:3-dehydroquinate dehydratase-2